MTQTLTLGGNLYTVRLDGFFSESGHFIPPYNGGGGIGANISAEKLGVAPEPSSLLLACLGLPSLGLAGWFSRQRRKIVDSNAGKA
ncbi:MAG TPA: PEP-CTERM sorting domain-containing protein [Gemmataceae bacterium]